MGLRRTLCHLSRIELVHIERYGEKRSIGDIDEVPRGYVAGVFAAWNQNVPLTSLERMRRDLGVVGVTTVDDVTTMVDDGQLRIDAGK